MQWMIGDPVSLQQSWAVEEVVRWFWVEYNSATTETL